MEKSAKRHIVLAGVILWAHAYGAIMEFNPGTEINCLHLRFTTGEVLFSHRKRYNDHDLLHEILLETIDAPLRK